MKRNDQQMALIQSKGSPFGRNAALYAISILALSDPGLAAKLRDFRKKQREKVVAADAELQRELGAR